MAGTVSILQTPPSAQHNALESNEEEIREKAVSSTVNDLVPILSHSGSLTNTAMETRTASRTTTTTSTSCPIRVISFDLDNTLWCTMSTIGAGLDAVDAFLRNEHSIELAVRTETVMKEMFLAQKSAYAPLLGDEATCPSQLTQLRIDALSFILHTHHGKTTSEALDLATQAFHVMSRARHEAIPQHMASRVVETLEQIRNRLGQDVKIGAITDGNADPRNVAALEPYFDFVIQAEAVGVGKPHPHIFARAIREVVKDNKDGCVDPSWVHIGDDFAKDIVGAKQVGMRTIWCREFIQSKILNEKIKPVLHKDLSSGWGASTSCSENAEKDMASRDTQLACADATVDRFADIVQLLELWASQARENGHP